MTNDYKTVLRSIAPLATLAFGCAPFGAPHTTLHPSRTAAAHAAGASGGAVYSSTTTDPETPVDDPDTNTTAFAIPYGEGWGRFALGPGQLEVRMSSNAGSVGYRIDLVSSPSLVFALLPELGAGYWSGTSESDIAGSVETSTSSFTIAPTLSGILMFGGGVFYLGPRIAFQYVSASSKTGANEQKGTTSLFRFGAVLGTILAANPFDVSLEAGGYGYFGGGEEETSFGMARRDIGVSGFMIVGSVGIQLSAPTAPPPPPPEPATTEPAPMY